MTRSLPASTFGYITRLLVATLAIALVLLLSEISHANLTSHDSQRESNRPFDDICELTILQFHDALRENEITCEELVKRYLDRIERYDESTLLNAITNTNPQAIDRARELDEEFRRTGKLRPLHGVPMIVKDNYDVVGLATTAGSESLLDNFPPDNATQVQRLLDAGAIVLAKSNMAEFAFSPNETVSSVGGVTRNPYGLAHVPAGSSGGTAAAIAANFGLIGLGTDTGNSIRGPSAHCCLVGIRSTMGTTSRDGIVPLYLRNDIGGPMCRSVEDTIRVFEVIAGPDPKDPVTELGQDRIPDTYFPVDTDRSLAEIRVGVLTTLSHRANADREVSQLFDRAIEDLRQLGIVVVEDVELEDLGALQMDLWKDTFNHDLAKYLAGHHDTAVRNLSDVIRTGDFHDSIRNRLIRSSQVPILSDEALVYSSDPKDDRERRRLTTAVLELMDQHDLDALTFPTWSNPARRVDDLASPDGNNSYQIPPHTGQPAITVPMGFVESGLPAGIQFVGRSFQERLLFEIAFRYERATNHRQPPAPFPKLDSDEN